MYINPFGLGGGGGNPYQALEQQIRKQLEDVERLGREAVASFQAQQQPQQTQQASQPMQALVMAIEQNMKPDDLQFLSQNIHKLPGFVGTKDGQDILQMVVDGLRRVTNENASASENTAAPTSTEPPTA